jgi:endoglycosylceramidase
MRRPRHATGRLRGIALTLALVAVGAAPTLTATAAPTSSSNAEAAPAFPLGALPYLHATVGDHPGIVDDQGRQLVLRGVNLNSLGDYYQANPAYAPTVPVTNADWDLMAAQGFNSVRLLVSWSKLEPTKGTIDTAYLAQIHDAVDAAAARGMYTVIDMHQDAWGKYIATPPGTTCPDGLQPAIGWDGAPDWATITDGADTCNDGTRENSEAVKTAWDSFWSDREGIQTELISVWSRLATEFAADPNVAGYDLLNEPNPGHNPIAGPLGAFYAKTITAIRQAELASAGADVRGHVVFFEYSVNGEPVDPGFTTDTNIVFAPHVYGGSIGPISVSGNWGFVKHLALGYKTAIWSGEYGWFNDPDTNQAKLAEWAGYEDQLIAGSAWWQWRQACGDPHSISVPGGTPPAILIHYQENQCPGDVNGGVVPQWRTIVGRPYPRALPGTITALGSNGPDATLAAYGTVAAEPAVGRTFVIWIPDRGTGTPKVGGTSVAGVTVTAVDGGFLATGTVCGNANYDVRVGADAADAPAACPADAPTTAAPTTASPTTTTGVNVPAGSDVAVTSSGTDGSTVATPVDAVPSYTG